MECVKSNKSAHCNLTMVTTSFKNVQVTDIAPPFNVRIGQFFFTFLPLSTNLKLILNFLHYSCLYSEKYPGSYCKI